MYLSVRFFLTVFGLAFFGNVFSAPSQITQAQFNSLAGGNHRVVETFDEFSTGAIVSPATLANGTYNGGPLSAFDTSPWCVPALTNVCLDTGFSDFSFSQFPTNTTLWGATLYYASTPDQVQITVVGKGGNSQFIPVPPSLGSSLFVGFYDPAGLLSVTFHQIPVVTPDIDVDDIQTVAATGLVGAVINSQSLIILMCALILIAGCWKIGTRPFLS